MVPGSARNWIALNAVQQSSINKQTKDPYENLFFNLIHCAAALCLHFISGMNRFTRWLPWQAALLLLMGTTLHAQTIVPVADFSPPPAHSFIIGLVSPIASGKILLVTVDDVFSYPVYAGSSLSFSVLVPKLPLHVNGIDPTSLVAAHPQDATKLLFTNVPDTTFTP